MNPTAFPQKPGALQKQTLNILWVAFFGALFIYCFVGYMARRGIPDQNSPALGLAFILAALGNYVFAWWWQRFKIAGLLKQASDAASRRDKTQLWNSLRQLQAHVIVFLAIVEAPVIYGFVHRLINAYFPQLMEHFLVVSVIIFVVFRRGTMAEIFRLYDQADSIQ